MYECISFGLEAIYDSKNKIKMLATCPPSMFAQRLCCHIFEALTRAFRKSANGDQVLLNFWWRSGIKGDNTPISWMRNHCLLKNLTLQGESGGTVVGLLNIGGIAVPTNGLT